MVGWALTACGAPPVVLDLAPVSTGCSWHAGDHHVHTRYSVGYSPDEPTVPILGGDARYEPERIAREAVSHGLDWLAYTDHGGPLHSEVTGDLQYPAILEARRAEPQLTQFVGMELPTPAADHTTVMIPPGPDELAQLVEFERRFASSEVFPADPARDTEARMLEALRFLSGLPGPPLVIANHPARTVETPGGSGATSIAELRAWDDAAPEVVGGMEAAPGHQAGGLEPDGGRDTDGARGGYRRVPTFGGYDHYSAELGGVWDALLGDGRHWGITATSDMHSHVEDGGTDFWPGEYQKTYVCAAADATSILDGLRAGRTWVASGELVTAVEVELSAGADVATIGEELVVRDADPVVLRATFRDPAVPNASGDQPDLARVDVIVGQVDVPSDRRRNGSVRVVARLDEGDWSADGELRTVEIDLGALGPGTYVRLRGTNTDQVEPLPDSAGEDPWSDLWFYTSAIFVTS